MQSLRKRMVEQLKLFRNKMSLHLLYEIIAFKTKRVRQGDEYAVDG